MLNSESHSEERDDKIQEINNEIEKTKESVHQSINLVIDRGERLDNLMDRSEHLAENASMFNRQSKRLRRKMWWKKIRMALLLIFILFLIIMLFIWGICGINFKHCKSN